MKEEKKTTYKIFKILLSILCAELLFLGFLMRPEIFWSILIIWIIAHIIYTIFN